MPTTEEVPQKNRRPGLFDFLFGHFMQTVFEIVLSLFFSRMEILGSENFPRYGPAIVVGNHNNQFADGILLASKCYGQGRDVCSLFPLSPNNILSMMQFLRRRLLRLSFEPGLRSQLRTHIHTYTHARTHTDTYRCAQTCVSCRRIDRQAHMCTRTH